MLEGNSLPPKGSKRLLHYYRFEVTKERNSINTVFVLCGPERIPTWTLSGYPLKRERRGKRTKGECDENLNVCVHMCACVHSIYLP